MMERKRKRYRPTRACAAALLLIGATGASRVGAFEMDLAPEAKLRWDNTFKYSAAVRVKEASSTLTSNANYDDGDRNFSRGLISNRLDWLSELDLTYRNFGARVSGAAWYDSIYNRHNDNDSPATVNSTSVPFNHFTDATQTLHGQKAELLDAFVFGKFDLGDTRSSLRLGRHAFLYGESLFFGNNGIAAAQAPIDAIKVLSVPNTQFKELLRPVNQVSGQMQLPHGFSLGGYYQLEWRRTRVPAAGSYFSNADMADAGGERIIAAEGAAGPIASFYRGRDQEARNSGQGGLQLRYRVDAIDTDFGLYFARYHDKNFQVYLRPGAGVGSTSPVDQIGQYNLVFPENIRTFGASFSTTVGEANVGGEISIRRNAPLVGDPQVVAGNTAADNSGNPLYPVGSSAHAQLSVITVLPRSPLWASANLIGEVAWNRRLSIDRNAAALDANTTRDAAALRVVLEPSYFQVMEGLDISVPIGIGYSPFGRSSAVAGFGGGAYHGGDLSIGVNGEYLKVWKIGLNYTHYYGGAAPLTTPAGTLTFGQTLKDRDFVSFTLSRTI
ncbi:DUF1302 domain-containing protein [Cupriavidus necator]